MEDPDWKILIGDDGIESIEQATNLNDLIDRLLQIYERIVHYNTNKTIPDTITHKYQHLIENCCRQTRIIRDLVGDDQTNNIKNTNQLVTDFVYQLALTRF